MLRRVGNADYVCFFKLCLLPFLYLFSVIPFNFTLFLQILNVLPAWSGEMQNARFVEVHARLELERS